MTTTPVRATPVPPPPARRTARTKLLDSVRSRAGLRLLIAIARRPLGAFSLAVVVMLLLVAAFGGLLAPHPADAMPGGSLQPPSGEYWMGTDQFGRDVFSRFLAGARVSLVIAIVSVTIAALAGATLGLLAALWAGNLGGGLIMRAMDVILAFPLLVLVPVVTTIVGARLASADKTLLISSMIGLVFIPLFARVARASVLAELRESYIEAARAYGTPRRTVLLRHIVPNISAPLIVQAAFAVAIAVEIEAAISFLGLGVQPPDASWGTILHDARRFITLGAWWLAAFPCLGIAVTALSFNVLADVARDELDPRSRRAA
ncbi:MULTISPECIES: ABC transporter permease [unclassified Solwaraspora]|uniref:ABC transporter permease n=1 Tax=unclassified Solwaraspora TaxID=2627926 RepID=UPI00259B25D3|nr:ABC transporter permease [Solwaraspora sp. WMMA2056]WJK43032.1 ABC transporter permease [Solwaraspora sp. WMMA2056]